MNDDDERVGRYRAVLKCVVWQQVCGALSVLIGIIMLFAGLAGGNPLFIASAVSLLISGLLFYSMSHVLLLLRDVAVNTSDDLGVMTMAAPSPTPRPPPQPAKPDPPPIPLEPEPAAPRAKQVKCPRCGSIVYATPGKVKPCPSCQEPVKITK